MMLQPLMLKGRPRFKVRPGYSSGASSFDGSGSAVTMLDGVRVAERIDVIDSPPRRSASTSDVLGLSNLRKEMVADGDLTKTVVRIEVRMQQPHKQPAP